jgi:hypothetical protein
MAIETRGWCTKCRKTGPHSVSQDNRQTTCGRCGGLDTCQEGNHGEAFLILLAGLIFFFALFFCGCADKVVLTPSITQQCPVCKSTATLTEFDEYEADYDCPQHLLEYSRGNGSFRSARIKPEVRVKADKLRAELERQVTADRQGP